MNPNLFLWFAARLGAVHGFMLRMNDPGQPEPSDPVCVYPRRFACYATHIGTEQRSWGDEGSYSAWRANPRLHSTWVSDNGVVWYNGFASNYGRYTYPIDVRDDWRDFNVEAA